MKKKSDKMFGQETSKVKVEDVDCGDETILRLMRDGEVFAHVTIKKSGNTHTFDVMQRNITSDNGSGTDE